MMLLNFVLRVSPALAFLLGLSITFVHAAPYETDNVKCDGFPRVMVETLDGLCLGLVTQSGPFIKPRSIVALPGGRRFVISDMGGWSAGKGKILLLQLDGEHRARLVTLFDKLDRPHGLAVGPHGMIYYGEPSRIRRFSLSGNQAGMPETIIDGLPDWEGHLHPLSMFVFDKNWNLVINTGASTDQCYTRGSEPPAECRFRSQAGLRLYRYRPADNSWKADYSMLAVGLRNSMALAVHESGTLLQAENSMDFSDAAEPYEEINVIEKGGDYGWPYCYNRNAVNPQWAAKSDACNGKDYRAPWSLMPPHTAPLGMLYYRGALLPPLQGKLIVSWHGYRVVGNRIVAYAVDAQGRPLRLAGASYWSDPLDGETGRQQHRFSPDGGMEGVAQHLEIVSGWNRVAGVRPEGAPVGMTVADDGSLYIVDDKNRAVLRLSSGPTYRDKPVAKVAEAPVAVAVSASVSSVLKHNCMPCHVELRQKPELLLNRNKWLAEEEGGFVMEQRIFDSTSRAMPPGNPLDANSKKRLQHWFDNLRREPSQ